MSIMETFQNVKAGFVRGYKGTAPESSAMRKARILGQFARTATQLTLVTGAAYTAAGIPSVPGKVIFGTAAALGVLGLAGLIYKLCKD